MSVKTKSPLGRVLCFFGFHQWFYSLHDYNADCTIRKGYSLREKHCPTCKCTWLQDGVVRTCRRGCGTYHTWERYEGWH